MRLSDPYRTSGFACGLASSYGAQESECSFWSILRLNQRLEVLLYPLAGIRA